MAGMHMRPKTVKTAQKSAGKLQIVTSVCSGSCHCACIIDSYVLDMDLAIEC